MHIDFVCRAYSLKNQTKVKNINETGGLEWFISDEILNGAFGTFEDVKVVRKKIFD